MYGESRMSQNGFRTAIDGMPSDDRLRVAAGGPSPARPGWLRRRATRIGPILVGLLLLVGSGLVTLLTLVWLGQQAARLPVPWAEALAGAAFLLLAAWVLASGRPRARRVAREDRLRARRVEVYGGLIDLWGTGPDPDTPTARAALWPLERQLALIGSAPVLVHYALLHDLGAEPGPEGDERLGALIAAMRHDLLSNRSRIEPATLARLARQSA